MCYTIYGRYTYRKLAGMRKASFFDLDRGQVFQIFCIMLQDAIYRAGCKRNVLKHRNLFFAFPLLLSSSCFLSHPFPLSLSVLSLSLISDPFFMHYSITLNSHLQCITSSHLSQTHFVLLSPSFSHFDLPLFLPHSPPVHYDTFFFFSPSPPLLSLCLLSSHIILYEALLSPLSLFPI